MIIILNRREKMSVLMVALIFCSITFYYYMSQLQNNFQTVRSEEARCEEKLEQINYQLVAVTEYKHRIDKLLTETKESYDNDKARFQDIMDSYVAMKQQCVFCQAQFEDLQTECMNAKEQLKIALKSLETVKTNQSSVG